MARSSKVRFHFYKSGHVAAQIVEDFETDSVFTEILFFCLLVSRTLLKFAEKKADLGPLIKLVDGFRVFAFGLSNGTVGMAEVRDAEKDNPWSTEFNGVPGNAQITAALTVRAPNVVDYQFDTEEQGWFGLFGMSKHLAYGSAMRLLWSMLIKRRIDDLQYARSLNSAGYLLGAAFFERKLSRQTELDIVRGVINQVIGLQQSSEANAGEPSGYAVNIEGLIEVASQGDTRAQSLLGMLYEQGNAVLQDLSEAAKWYSKAAEAGQTEAQSQLADMYFYGKGVPQDYAEAAKWYLRAAEAGHAGDQTMLGLMYANGWGFTQDYSKAFVWLKKAAEQGREVAQTEVGIMYGKGLGVSQNYSEGVKWFRTAAEKGYAPAQVNLGLAYENGWGVPQDYPEAIRWYHKAAAQDYAHAKYCLGYLMIGGLGTAKDLDEGWRLISEAAGQGEPDAQYAFGILFEKRGDRSEAAKWYRQAADNGSEAAKEKLRSSI